MACQAEGCKEGAGGGGGGAHGLRANMPSTHWAAHGAACCSKQGILAPSGSSSGFQKLVCLFTARRQCEEVCRLESRLWMASVRESGARGGDGDAGGTKLVVHRA